MWILQLNHIRDHKIEMLQQVACAPTKEALERLIERERVDTYYEEQRQPYGPGQWAKGFREGGPLEWHNAPDAHMLDEHFVDIGTREEFVERAGQQFDDLTTHLLRVD